MWCTLCDVQFMDASGLIETKIKIAADAAVQSMAAGDDAIAAAVVGRNTNAYLLINSSFLFRETSVKTIQSPRRLLVQITASKQHVRAGTVAVSDDETIAKHYKLISRQVPVSALETAVQQEIGAMGDLIFILIGTIKGIRPHAQTIKGDKVQELRLDPSIGSPIQNAEDGIYCVKNLLPIDELFYFIDHDLREIGGLSDRDRVAVRKGYDEMMDGAVTEVAVPTGDVRRGETVLGKIASSMRSQTTEYAAAIEALRHVPEDQHSLHEVLRIAYNFSADVIPLLTLFVSVCDLKPLVFWCTVKEQWALRQAFAALPWASLGRKEKLEEYRAIVSQARSHAFHHVLPFDTTVEVDLSTLDVRAETIRLFVPFGKKEGRGVHLKDQKLADVLAEFSRAKERPVSNTFWQANLAVMKAASKLAEEVLDTLVLIHDARRAMGRRPGQ
jgi:hypothetical protein